MARLLLIMLSLSTSLAWGAPNTSNSDSEDWDDDVWSDWGTPANAGNANSANSANAEAPKAADGQGSGTQPIPQMRPAGEAKADAGLDKGDSNGFLPESGGSSTGVDEGAGRVRFRLVREGYNDTPRGVRKFRPPYGKKRI